MSKIKNYLVKNPPIQKAVVGYIVRGNEVLLGVRTRVSNDLGYLTIAGIGGKVEKGESLEDALTREFLEEIEVHVTDYRLVGRTINLSPHRPAWNLDIAIYLITGFEGEPKKTTDIEPRWYAKDKLPLADMWQDNQVTAPLVLAGKRIMSSFLYGEDGQLKEQNLRELRFDESIKRV